MSVQLRSFPFCVVEGRLVKTLLAGVLSDSVISSVFFRLTEACEQIPGRTEKKFGERETEECGKLSNRGGTGLFGLAGSLLTGASPWDIAVVWFFK